MRFSGITNAIVYALPGWMNYVVRLPDGTERKVIYRNHGTSYIRLGGKCTPVYFNQWDTDNGETPCEVLYEGV